ncbi:MAG: hypothetical protein WKG07_30850 [Hymenobacter sp.]
MLAALLLLLLLTTSAALAQRSGKGRQATNADGSLIAPPPARRRPPAAAVWRPRCPADAVKLFGPARLDAIAASFASRAEASSVFRRQRLTSTWPKASPTPPPTASTWPGCSTRRSADAYRGLGVVASSQPTPDAAIALLSPGPGPGAPPTRLLLSDLGASYLMRYGQTQQEKGPEPPAWPCCCSATAAEPTNARGVASSWPAAIITRKTTPLAWEAVHEAPVP